MKSASIIFTDQVTQKLIFHSAIINIIQVMVKHQTYTQRRNTSSLIYINNRKEETNIYRYFKGIYGNYFEHLTRVIKRK